MPNSFGSTESRLYFVGRGFLKTASSDSANRSRGARRSAGVSFMPSGTHTFVTQVLPRALPMSAPISRQRRQCSIQNCRMLLSRLDKVNPSADFGCEKHVGL